VSDWFYSKASSKMRKEEYKEAIDIYMKVLDLEKDSGIVNAITLFEIGYCHYNCDHFDKALHYFTKSYNIYKKNKTIMKMKPFYYLLIYYSSLLKRKGDIELADQIFKEAKEIEAVKGSIRMNRAITK